MAMLKGNISKINGSAGNLTFKQTGSQTIVSLSHTPSAPHLVVHEGSMESHEMCLITSIICHNLSDRDRRLRLRSTSITLTTTCW